MQSTSTSYLAKYSSTKKIFKKTKQSCAQQSIRDHFLTIRRSSRKAAILLEREKSLRLLSKNESGLKTIDIGGKGKGVIATRPFNKGELICEYSGELITHSEASRREELYAKDSSIGCYMYYFQYKRRKLCVDATADNSRHGRLVNHSKKHSNVLVRVISLEGQLGHPFLCLIAQRNIETGEELQYDYGERDKNVIASYPWLST